MIEPSSVAPHPLTRSTGSASSDILGTSSSSLLSESSTSTMPTNRTDRKTTNVRRGTRGKFGRPIDYPHSFCGCIQEFYRCPRSNCIIHRFARWPYLLGLPFFSSPLSSTSSSSSLVTNPVLYSMIAKNNMTDCHEIQDLYSKCMDSSPQQSRPIICETAHKLYVQCHVSEK